MISGTIPNLQALVAQSDLATLGCGPGLISYPVGQAKLVAFSVEGKEKAKALLQDSLVHRIDNGWPSVPSGNSGTAPMTANRRWASPECGCLQVAQLLPVSLVPANCRS